MSKLAQKALRAIILVSLGLKLGIVMYSVYNYTTSCASELDVDCDN